MTVTHGRFRVVISFEGWIGKDGLVRGKEDVTLIYGWFYGNMSLANRYPCGSITLTYGPRAI